MSGNESENLVGNDFSTGSSRKQEQLATLEKKRLTQAESLYINHAPLCDCHGDSRQRLAIASERGRQKILKRAIATLTSAYSENTELAMDLCQLILRYYASDIRRRQ